MKKKINAYTITELLVVLLVSMLVVTCILQLFTYTNIHTVSLLKKQDSQREVMQCISYLQLNAKRSESMVYDDDRVTFSFFNNRYRYLSLTPNLLMVQDALQDTLHISFAITDTVNLSNGKLSIMNVGFNTEHKKYSTYICKQYSRANLINQLERREYFIEPATQ